MSALATLLLSGLLAPIAFVFVVSYRQALSSWLGPTEGPRLPPASIGRRPPREVVPLARRFHAVIIATAFTSVFTMALVAVALVATMLAAA